MTKPRPPIKPVRPSPDGPDGMIYTLGLVAFIILIAIVMGLVIAFT